MQNAYTCLKNDCYIIIQQLKAISNKHFQRDDTEIQRPGAYILAMGQSKLRYEAKY